MIRRMMFLALAGLLLAPAGASDRSDQDSPRIIPQPDYFNTLVNPQCSHCRDEAKRRAGELREDDRVLAWTRGKYDGGAVPVRFFLAPYRVISDTYGVWVYDADAGYMRGFEPSLDFTFYGWRNGIMVIRHKDGTLYSALTGVAFDGPRKGDRLKPLATVPSDWGWWLRHYPGTVAYHMFDKYKPVDLPTSQTPQSVKTRPKADPRLPEMEQVIGVEIGGEAKAYPISELRQAGGLIADTVSGRRIVVLWHEPTHAGSVYLPTAEQQARGTPIELLSEPKDPDAPFVSRDGSHWDITGRAVDGPHKGQALQWQPNVSCYWFAWAAEYPKTAVYQPKPRHARVSAELIGPDAVTSDRIKCWKDRGVNAVILALDEKHGPQSYHIAADLLAQSGVALYYWLEVARNQPMADAHPQWMASLGVHHDWHSQFPQSRLPEDGRVAKAYPWAPITSKPAFDAHLTRIESLLRERAAGDWRALLLNDLQAGPSSCGCGNPLCRWATDYKVPATCQTLAGDDVAARFLARVRELAPGKQLIPVWTTECEEIDLPAALAPGGNSTGLSGGVPCAHATCPLAFTRQWSALVADNPGPVALLADRTALRRPLTDPVDWPARYLDRVLPAHAGTQVAHERLWLVVREAEIRDVPTDFGGVVAATDAIDQSFEPRIFSAK